MSMSVTARDNHVTRTWEVVTCCVTAPTRTTPCLCVVGFSGQSIIGAGSAFDLSGQTCPECELTGAN